jgi:hypothetical protein
MHAIELDFDAQMLRNLVEVLRLLDSARPSASSAGLELLLAARGAEENGGGGGAAAAPQLLPPKLAVPHYVRREADAAWDCMQARALHAQLPVLTL